MIYMAVQLLLCMAWTAIDLISLDGINDASLFHILAGVEGGSFYNYLPEYLPLTFFMLGSLASGYIVGRLIKAPVALTRDTWFALIALAMLVINPLFVDLARAMYTHTFCNIVMALPKRITIHQFTTST